MTSTNDRDELEPGDKGDNPEAGKVIRWISD